MKPKNNAIPFSIVLLVLFTGVALASFAFQMAPPSQQSSGWGMRNGTMHTGTDITNLNMGATHGGTVSVHQQAGMAGYGNYVYVTNGNFRTMYAHAGSVSVQNGQQVTAGQQLGDWSQCSGTCRGAGGSATSGVNNFGQHIHFETQVNVNGTWYQVDPRTVERLVAQGLSPQDSGFAERAIAESPGARAATTQNPNAVAGGGGAGNTPANGQGNNPMCDSQIRARVSEQAQAYSALMQNITRETIRQPIPPNQGANTPCNSSELQRISNQFSYAPSNYLNQGVSSVSGLGGPVSGIVRRMFRAEFEGMNRAISGIPSMLSFQQAASSQLGSALESIGISEEFSSELCGLMTDTVLRYIQCEVPFNLPSLGSLTGGLNIGGCAGQAVIGGLYRAANSNMLDTVAQPVRTLGGQFIPGSASELSAERREQRQQEQQTQPTTP